MPSIQPRGGRFQLRVVHKLLPKPFFWTFDDRPAAEDYGDKLVALLDRGIVPAELLPKPADGRDATPLVTVIERYVAAATPTTSEAALLDTLRKGLKGVSIHQVTYAWVEAYVAKAKLGAALAPGSIRKRVGALARVLDWYHRTTTGRDQVNPFRLLPRGYSAYAGGERVDISRDRRLLPAEEAAVRLALSGVKREGRERALAADPEFTLMFELILETGVRLSEAFRLRVDQVDGVVGVIRLQGSKAARGRQKPRVVPLKPVIRARLVRWCEGRVGLVFSFWDGTAEGVRRATNRLSARFSTLFDYAGVLDFTEHDLRHEAACRWVTLKVGEGWAFSDVELCRILGWTDTKMLLRYASLRGEDLVDRLGAFDALSSAELHSG